jgi:hypothetical protein
MERQGEYSTRDLAEKMAAALGLPRKRVYEAVLKMRSATQR